MQAMSLSMDIYHGIYEQQIYSVGYGKVTVRVGWKSIVSSTVSKSALNVAVALRMEKISPVAYVLEAVPPVRGGLMVWLTYAVW